MISNQAVTKPNMPVWEAVGLILLYLAGLKGYAYLLHLLGLDGNACNPVLLRIPLYLAFSAFFIYRARQYNPSFMGLQKPVSGWWWRILPVWGQSVVGILLLLVALLVCVFVLKSPAALGEIFMVLPFFIAVGINEELLFRSFLIVSTRPKIGWFWAVVLSGVVFGLIHMQNSSSWADFQNVILWQSIQNIGPGLMYATAFYICRSVYPLIVIHTVWDFGLYSFQTMGKYMTEDKALKSIPLPTSIPKSTAVDNVTQGVVAGVEQFSNMPDSLKSIGLYIAVCLLMLGLNHIHKRRTTT